jgi:hypothetical protein
MGRFASIKISFHVPTYTIKDHQIGTEIQRLKKRLKRLRKPSGGWRENKRTGGI